MKTFVSFALLILIAGPASAQIQSPSMSQPANEHGWIDVNLGVAASGANAETFTFTDRISSEIRAFASLYPKPSRGADFDFGGGYMFTPLVGLGVNITGTAHEDTAAVGVTAPHPFFFNASDTDASLTEHVLLRQEGAFNVQMMLAPIRSDRVRLRVFGGPSLFRYRADMVQDVEDSQLASFFSRANLVTITGYESEKAEGSGVGFHVGSDLSWFFSRVVGVGGFARFSHGTVTVDPEPMSQTAQDVTVGGFQTGGGLRLRF